jgi:hypothetical protein
VNRGDLVDVVEPGITPWSGVVKAMKLTPKHGLFVEIERDGTDRECWSIQECHVSVRERPGPEAYGEGASGPGEPSPTGDTRAEPQAVTAEAGDTPASRVAHPGLAMVGSGTRSDRSSP